MSNSMQRNDMAGSAEAENRREFFACLGVDESSAARCRQVHGDNVCIVDSPTDCPDTDGLVTRSRNLFLAVSIADCVPVLIFDRRLKAAAAVHSGWKGTLKNIVGKTMKLLLDELNSNPEDVVAYIGPSAGVCCYEIGEDISKSFDKKYLSSARKPGRSRLDLKRAVASQLVEGGLPERNIEISGACTICDTNYHSYRRDGALSGRMLAAIAIE